MPALIGVLVSSASWCFLELVHWIQQEVYKSLPSGLGLHPVPLWWPLPVLAVAGVLAAVAIVHLPGRGGHIPYEGIKAGTAKPIELPGILLAALATLGLGLVPGPEAPLIALGGGLAIVAVRLVRKDTPDQVMAVLAASAAFAAIATIFGSPVKGAIILIEAGGLGGPMLPLEGWLTGWFWSLILSMPGLPHTWRPVADPPRPGRVVMTGPGGPIRPRRPCPP